jgi:glycosyltransferase involved in cell wall biosynthesis
MNESLVTIYIPTHNRKNLLTKAIESVLNQTYKNIEIIVVDDASSDGTKELLKEYSQKYINFKYIILDKASGANIARNRAIKMAQGKFVTGLDDDDEMLPDRVEKLVNAYDDEIAFVTSRYYTKSKEVLKKKILTFKTQIDLNDVLYGNIIGNQVLTTKQKFIESGLFDEKLLAGQDIDMWIRLLKNRQFAKIIKEPLQIVNISDNDSRITNSSNKIRGYFQVYFKHKSLMSINQRKYRLVGLMILKNKSLIKLVKMIPNNPKYMLLSLLKIFKYILSCIKYKKRIYKIFRRFK